MSGKTCPPEGANELPQPQIRVRGNELRPSVDRSVDAADVGVCATTSDTASPAALLSPSRLVKSLHYVRNGAIARVGVGGTLITACTRSCAVAPVVL